MTKFKIYRISGSGKVTVEIAEAYDWMQLISNCQWFGDPIFKIEAVGGPDPVQP